jgi:hypothetical protein
MRERRFSAEEGRDGRRGKELPPEGKNSGNGLFNRAEIVYNEEESENAPPAELLAECRGAKAKCGAFCFCSLYPVCRRIPV